MNIQDRDRLHAVLDARLSDIATSLLEPPPWYEPWLRLGPESTWEERLLVCQGVRDLGSLPDEVGYFLVSWIIEDLAIAVEPERVDRLHSLNRRESRRASDRIFADLLDQHGEHEMAERFRTDPLGHARRREVGRRFFFKKEGAAAPEEPAWVKGFVKVVSSSLLTDRSTGHLGIRYREDNGLWEISVYPIQGGGDLEESEGSVASPSFAWDIEELRSVFDRIDGSGWYAVCPGGTESPYVWIEGDYQDHEVFLRLLPGAPVHDEPGSDPIASVPWSEDSLLPYAR
jgi:hypothetical protein